jgi:hypothetical protein
MLYTFMLFVTHYCFVVLVLHVPCSRWSRCWSWCLMLYRPSFRYAFMLYALFIYAFCNALLLCSSGCCMPRALGGADAGADERCFIVLNMLSCFMLYAFHAFSELWNLVPSRRKVVFQKSEAGNIFYCWKWGIYSEALAVSYQFLHWKERLNSKEKTKKLLHIEPLSRIQYWAFPQNPLYIWHQSSDENAKFETGVPKRKYTALKLGGEIQNRQRWWHLNGEALAVINQFLPRKKRYKVEIYTTNITEVLPLSNIQSWAFHQTVLYFLDQSSNRYM